MMTTTISMYATPEELQFFRAQRMVSWTTDQIIMSRRRDNEYK
jgi:hypothetical protein